MSADVSGNDMPCMPTSGPYPAEGMPSALEPMKHVARRRLDTLPASIRSAIRDINRQLNHPEGSNRIIVCGGAGVGKTFVVEQLAVNLERLPSAKGARRRMFRMTKPSDDTLAVFDACDEVKGMGPGVIVSCGTDIYLASMMGERCPDAKFIVEGDDEAIAQAGIVGDLDGFDPVPVSSSVTWGELSSESRRMSSRMALSLGLQPMEDDAVDAFMIGLLHSIYPSRKSRPDDDEDMDITFGYVADRMGYAYARSLEHPYCGSKIDSAVAGRLADEAFNECPPDQDQPFSQPDPAGRLLQMQDGQQRRQTTTKQRQRLVGYRDPLRLPDRLRREVVGQDKAIRVLSSKILLDAAGMKRPDKPVGSFLFVGPSGVGKTQLAKSLARELLDEPMNFIRIDCSELAERHTESRLFGSPPGYVGYDEGGELTGAVREHPQSVILMDEAEKADPHIWDVFLQVFDAARLTDGTGVTTDFSHCIIILTSNLGSDAKGLAGFGDRASDSSHAYKDAMKSYFRPEFINRLDGVCVFNRLDAESYRRIIDMKVDEAAGRMQAKYSRKVSIHLDDGTVSWLLDKAGGTDHGARGIDDVISDSILLPIAKGILTKDIDIAGTGTINVTIDGSGPSITTKAGID